MPSSFLAGARTATPDEAAQVIAAARAVPGAAAPYAQPKGAGAPATRISPGTERWPVKTGTDADVAGVDKTKIVDSTVRELGSLPRPADLMPPTELHDAYNAKRAAPVELTVWRVKAKVIALKLEADGDYHLVLQDDSGAEMVAEIPYPDNAFIATTSPFFEDVGKARTAVNDKFGQLLAQLDFAPSGTDAKLIPIGALPPRAQDASVPRKKVALVFDSTAAFMDADLFSARIDPADATITGVGFFDRAHGQTGAAANVIELHPVLAITFG
jgi:hypothetical protein